MPNEFTDNPNPGSQIQSVSRGLIRANFQYLQGSLGKDHQMVFGDTDTGTTFEGRHLTVSLWNQNNPDLPIPADGIDSYIWSSGGNVYWKNAITATGVQLTNSNVGSPSAIANGGYTFLPGGIMMCWGTQAISGTSSTVTFPHGGFSTVFVCNASLNQPARRTGVVSLGIGGFQFQVDTSVSANFYWQAIGAK